MSKAGDVYENPVTGERVVVRVGTEESTDGWFVNDLYVRPGGAVTGEHIHPTIMERFTVRRGQVGLRIDGRETLAEVGQPVTVPVGVPHDWWNAGEEEAHVLVEIYDPPGLAAGLSRHLPRIPPPPPSHCSGGTLGRSLEITLCCLNFQQGRESI